MAYTDGDLTTGRQHGAKKISFPLQWQGDYYATLTKRKYIALATAYDPIIEQRNEFTNLLTYSDDLTDSSWSKNATVATIGHTDPEGGTTASKLGETTDNSAHSASHAMTVGAGAVTFGCFFKAAERTTPALGLYNATDGVFSLTVFDLSAGTASGTGTIKRLLNGWFWCTISGTATVANSSVYVYPNTNGSFVGVAGYGVYVWRVTALTSTITPFPAIATTATTRGVTVPPVDPDDPIAFLVEETEADESELVLGVARWARMYARVPQQTVVPTSIQLSKPGVATTPTQIIGEFLLVQEDSTLNRFDAYERHTVTSDSGAVTAFYPTAGTYTIAFTAFTSGSLSFAATASPLQTALNAMTSVSNRGNVVVTGTYNSANGFDVTFTAITIMSLDISSITVSGGTKAYSGPFGSSGNYQQSTAIFASPHPSGTVNGGTFTVTILGQTTSAIAYNGTLAQLQTALNALSNIQARGNVTVTGAYSPNLNSNGDLGINFTITFTNPTMTGQSSSLVPSGTVINVAVTDGVGRTQRITFQAPSSVRSLYSPISHGITSGGTMYIKSTATYYTGITNYSVADPNTVVISVTAGDAFASATTIGEMGPLTLEDYEPGLKNVRALKTTDYYLPGFTPGVDDVSDIILPTSESDGDALLAALFSGTTEVNWKVGDLDFWMCPILSVQKITFDASDAT